MTKYTIPRSLSRAQSVLAEVGGLISAKQWERAAIVSAFVTVGEFGDNQHKEGVTSDTLTPVTFAALGIVGLKSKNTVQRYVETWLAHRPAPKPGSVVNFDGLPEWPGRKAFDLSSEQDAAIEEAIAETDGLAPNFTGATVGHIIGSPKSLEVALKADPETRETARRVLDEIDVKAVLAKHGVDGPVETGLEYIQEYLRITAGLESYIRPIRALHTKCTPDQWVQVERHINESLNYLAESLVSVPDTVEEMFR